MAEVFVRPDTAPNGVAARPELVVIAASAGGIPAIRQVLQALPPSFPAAVVLLLHRAPSSTSVLPRILARGSGIAVHDAAAGERFAAGVAYIAPADRHLQVSPDRQFSFHDGRKINFLRSAADPLLQSAAAAFGNRVIAVILTGSGRNGTGGVRDVKARGGIVIAQDPATAEHAGMPRAAIATGAVDYIVPLEEIGPLLVRLTRAPSPRQQFNEEAL
jgi:two-component system chemotaxis response regulator CheB